MKVETRTHVSFTLDELRVMDDKAYGTALETLAYYKTVDSWFMDDLTEQATEALRTITGDRKAEVTEWDIDRGQSLSIRASFTFPLPERDGSWLDDLPLPPSHPALRSVNANDRYRIGRDCDVYYETEDGTWRESWALADDDDLKPVDEEVGEWLTALRGWLLAFIRTEYEYQLSEEVLVEDAEANEWMFDEHGRLV